MGLLVPHPAIAAGGIQIYIRAQIRQHQGFTKISRAKVRNDESHSRITKRDRMEVDRIRKTHVELRRQAELLADADAQDAAVDEDDDARPGGSQIQQGSGPLILHRVSMHGREKAQSVKMAAR